MQRALILALLVSCALADMYLHYPPGSNDRNRERNDNRNNGNRLFDSQNNGKGGYPWAGDATVRAKADPLTYFVGSVMRVEWTNQHGCNNPNMACQVIIQAACDPSAKNLVDNTIDDDPTSPTYRSFPGLRDGYPDSDTVEESDNNNAGYKRRRFSGEAGQNQDGTNTIPENQYPTDTDKQKNFYIKGNDGGVEYGMHENVYMYKMCRKTTRNKGLYTADQKLNTNDARATRQNPNGNRRGLECPEERDYYPYWNGAINHWVDLAVLTDDVAKCDYYKANSANVIAYGWCDNVKNGNGQTNTNDGATPITQQECLANGGTWSAGKALWPGNPPQCVQHGFGRDNHLGNVAPTSDSGSTSPVAENHQPETAHWNFDVPDFMTDQTCLIRVRYNMSTLDYPSQKYAYNQGQELGADSSLNCPFTQSNAGDNPDAQSSSNDGTKPQCFGKLTETTRPLYNRPYVDVFGTGSPKISIALNSNQAGRTFQDRSYVFNVKGYPDGLAKGKIYNLNVRGRRGNIVQCYPAVEYDFVPSILDVSTSDTIHIQIHGSDFNEAKNANNGEGWQYSSRSNVVQMDDASYNFPTVMTKRTLFSSDTLAKKWALLDQDPGQCKEYQDGDNNEQNSIQNCGKLNRAPARFPVKPEDGLLKVGNDVAAGGAGSYKYVSTRNNNFSNRSHKGQINVSGSEGLSTAAVAGIAVGTTLGVFLLLACLCFYGYKRPNSKMGDVYKASCGKCFGRSSPSTGWKPSSTGGTSTNTTNSPPDMVYSRN